MSNDKLNPRILTVENEVKKLRNETNRLSSEFSTVRQQCQTSVPPQQTTDQKDDTAEGKPSFTPEIPPAPTNRDQSKKPWYKTASGWKTLLELIGIPFAIGYAIITYVAWSDARHNFENTERAWLKIESSLPAQPGDMPVFVRTTNVGKSPATASYVGVWIEVLKWDQTPTLDEKEAGSGWFTGIMFPSDKAERSFTRHDPVIDAKELPITDQEREDLTSGKSYITAHGIVTYKDQFGVHWTRFCSWKLYKENSPTKTADCTAYNTVGDGIPTPYQTTHWH